MNQDVCLDVYTECGFTEISKRDRRSFSPTVHPVILEGSTAKLLFVTIFSCSLIWFSPNYARANGEIRDYIDPRFFENAL